MVLYAASIPQAYINTCARLAQISLKPFKAKRLQVFFSVKMKFSSPLLLSLAAAVAHASPIEKREGITDGMSMQTNQ